MSQNPDTKQRPDDEGGEGASRSSGKKDKGGLMAKLRAKLLARALGTAPVVAPAAGLAAAAAISAPDPASAQDEGDNEDEPSAREYFREDTPAPASAGNSEPPRTPKPPAKEKEEEKLRKGTEVQADFETILRKKTCLDLDLSPDCSNEDLTAAMEKRGKPLTTEETIVYVAALLGLLGTGLAFWGHRRTSNAGRRIDSIEEQLTAFNDLGIFIDMTPEQVREALLRAVQLANAEQKKIENEGQPRAAQP